MVRVKGKECKTSFEKGHEVCRFSISKSMVLPAKSLVTITCKVENGSANDCEHGVLEPAKKFEERYNLGILKVAAKRKNGQIPVKVRLFNFSSTAQRVYKGSTVGEFCPFVEENDADSESYYFIPKRKVTLPARNSGTCAMAVGTKMNATRNIEELIPINNSSLTKSEKSSVYQVLSQNPAVISSRKADLGEAKEVEHFINTGNAAPIRIPPRTLPFRAQERVSAKRS